VEWGSRNSNVQTNINSITEMGWSITFPAHDRHPLRTIEQIESQLWEAADQLHTNTLTHKTWED